MEKTHFLQAGFDVYESPYSLIVTTPQTFASGDPACFWVKEQNHRVIFNDYGHSLNALELSLPNPDNAIDIIKRTLKKLDNEIYLDGTAIIRETTPAQVSVAMGDYINLFALLTTYRPKTVHEQATDEILDQIRHYLVRRFGVYDEKVKFKGLSGTEHKFSFASNDHVFEFAHPSARTTGILLRKIHDVKLIHDKLEFSVFLDDSDKKLFDKESRILSSVSNIKPTSMLVA